MRPHLTALLLLAWTALAWLPSMDIATAQAARNPFIGAREPQEAPRKGPAFGYPAFLQPLMQRSAMLQQTIKQKMAGLAEEIRREPLGPAFRWFMLLALLYGVIHALGPGHGKVYACAYFLSRPGTFKNGLLFSYLTMLFHVLSGSALVLGGSLLLKTSGAMALESAGPILARISYGLLMLLGLVFAVQAVARLRAGPAQRAVACPETADLKSLMFTALAVGLVPCPGAALVLLFSLTLGILPAGIGAVICIAAGMGITVSLFALLTIGLKHRFLVLAQGNPRWFEAAYAALSLSGAAGISILGLLLFFSSST